MNNITLKLIALLAMVLDHLGFVFFPENDLFRVIGRVSFPIFAFLIANGHSHTSDVKKYLCSLFLFGLLSEIPHNYLICGDLYCGQPNVLFTLFCGLLIIHIISEMSKSGPNIGFLAVILGVLFVIYYSNAEYGVIGVCWVVAYRLFLNSIIGQILTTVFMNLIYYYISQNNGVSFMMSIQAYAVFSIVPILIYDGKFSLKSKYIKNLFYWFYPSHFLVLIFIKAVLI